MKHIICIVGNPNCGKTTLFNALTGSHQDVGNWPGVTVEKKVGHYVHDSVDYELADLPGIYSLTTVSKTGEDERVARDYILSQQAEAVINIVDASNLERNLYLTAQLIEMRVPVMLVVNMLDVAKKRKIEIDIEALGRMLGCPVVGIVASREQGVFALKEMIAEFLKSPTLPKLSLRYAPSIEKAHQEIEQEIQNADSLHPHWLAIELLEGANGSRESLDVATRARVMPIIERTEKEFAGNLDIAVADARYKLVADVSSKVEHKTGELPTTLTDRIDKIVLNRVAGFPIFLFIIYCMFLFTQNLGSAFIDFFDILVGGVMVTGFGELLEAIGVPEIVKVVLADGVGGGLQTVSTFIPVVFFLFFFLAILEDSGYMARAAFVMDRLMRFLGLPGRAFVPLIVGFGCNVPAVMATRTMDRVTDRILTVLMAPFMSCGARLPVYVLFAVAFFPKNGQNLVFGLYLIGIAAAVLTGFLVKKLILPDAGGSFVMEIPPYHIPTVKGVLIRTWDRLKSFVCRAGRVIVVLVACLSILNSLGTDGSFGNEDSDRSVLSEIGRTIAPVLSPMGVTQENWPAAVGVFTGVLAKEAVIGTMNSLYESMARVENAKGSEAGEEPEEPWSFKATVSEACASVVDNLKALSDSVLDPLGIAATEEETEASLSETDQATGADMMRRLFGSDTAAFAYLLLILLYMPCAAAMAAIWNEVGTAWTLFVAAWTTLLGYSAATIFYKVGTFATDPTGASLAIVLCLAALSVVLLIMRHTVKTMRKSAPKVIQIHQA